MKPEQLLQHFDRICEAPDAIPTMRRFAIELAVRGRLVEQDTNDESVSELLQRIRAEKIEMAQAGEITQVGVSSAVHEDEIPFEVPRNWQWVRLGSITSYIQRGKSPKYAPDDGLPVVSQKCVQWSGLHLEFAKIITRESLEQYEEVRFLRDNDLLWNSTGTGTIGRIIKLVEPPKKLVCDSHVTVVRCLQVNPEYIRSWLRSDQVYGSIEERASGSTKQVELTLEMAINQIVPLPPLAEQHRIVSIVNDLMVLCDRLEAAQADREKWREQLLAASLYRLNNGSEKSSFSEDTRFYLDQLAHLTARPQQIAVLRQIILNLAVRGKLVQQDPRDEPAVELLKRIHEKRKQQVTGRKTNDGGSQSSFTQAELPFDIPNKASASPTNQIEAPFELPQGWIWSSFRELGIFGRGKSKHRPRNDPSLFEGGTHLFVQTGDVARSHGYITTFSGKYNNIGLAQSVKWPKGTLCITIAANIADSGILSFDACFPDSVVGFIPDSEFPDAQYFEYFIRTAKSNLLEFAPATAQKNINLEILNSILIPLPPLEECQRIVTKVKGLMALCDQLQSQLRLAQAERRELLEALISQSLGTKLYQKREQETRATKRRVDQENDMQVSSLEEQMIQTGNLRFTRSNPVRTVTQLAECIDALGGTATPERLLNVSGLSDDVDTFYNLLREGRNSRILIIPMGANPTIQRNKDANTFA